MIEPVSARFRPVTGLAWRPAWWRAPPSAFRGGLRLALRSGVRLGKGTLRLGVRPARISALPGLAFAHGRPYRLSGSPGVAALAASAASVAFIATRPTLPAEAGTATARADALGKPESRTSALVDRREASAPTVSAEPLLRGEELPWPPMALAWAAPASQRHVADPSGTLSRAVAPTGEAPAPTVSAEPLLRGEELPWPPMALAWAAPASQRHVADPSGTLTRAVAPTGIFDNGEVDESRSAPPATAALAPAGRGARRSLAPTLPAPSTQGAWMNPSAEPEPAPPQPALRPRRGVEPRPLAAPPPSFGDALFDQAMQHRALPRFELRPLPAAPIEADAASAEQVRSAPRVASVPGRSALAELPPLTHAELGRVADQVERLLKQRERFERERRGGL